MQTSEIFKTWLRSQNTSNMTGNKQFICFQQTLSPSEWAVITQWSGGTVSINGNAPAEFPTPPSWEAPRWQHEGHGAGTGLPGSPAPGTAGQRGREHREALREGFHQGCGVHLRRLPLEKAPHWAPEGWVPITAIPALPCSLHLDPRGSEGTGEQHIPCSPQSLQLQPLQNRSSQ